MRIEFAHATHPALPWSGDRLRLGSAQDNDVRLDGQGVAGHHVVLARDARGLVLEVCRGAGRVYVNARPVREKALLRCGDSLGIGACRLHLVADAVPDADEGTDADGADAAVVMALRAVAGPLSGRTRSLDGVLALDDNGPVTAARRENVLVLEPCGRRVRLDATGLAEGRPVSVNGVEVRRALLGDGDQVVMGAHRFVLDISADTPAPPPPVAAPEPSGPETARRGNAHPEIWWLIATAAVLALVLAGALLVHF